MAVGDTHVFPGFHAPVLTRLSFQRHQLLLSHASEMRGESMPDSMPQLGTELTTIRKKALKNITGKGEYACNQHFFFFLECFQIFQMQVVSFEIHLSSHL